MENIFAKGSDCPPIQELEHAMALPAASETRIAMERHLAACASCTTELAMLVEFESGAARDEEREDVAWITSRMKNPGTGARVIEMKRPWIRSARGLTAMLAAAAALVIAVSVEWQKPRGLPDPQEDVMRSAPLRAIAPAGVSAAMPEEFRWTAVPGATKYELIVTEVDRTIVWTTTELGTTSTLPSDLRKILIPGKKLRWTVTAQDAVGREIATSGPQEFGVN